MLNIHDNSLFDESSGSISDHNPSFPTPDLSPSHTSSFSISDLSPSHTSSFPTPDLPPSHNPSFPTPDLSPAHNPSFPTPDLPPSHNPSFPTPDLSPAHNPSFPTPDLSPSHTSSFSISDLSQFQSCPPTKTLGEIEKSLNKRYRRYLWSPFIRALKNFAMIQAGDTIAVALSGGKDSLVMAKLFQELHRHSEIPFTPIFISMNPGYNEENLRQVQLNCHHLNIPVHFFDTDIFQVADKVSQEAPCYLCARMRRGALYDKAQSLGCNKLALGHHFDDVIETTLLNVLYNGSFKTMLPKLRSTGHPGMQIIRPMYYVREEDILRFTKNNGIQSLACGCSVSSGQVASKRREMKELIASMKIHNPNVAKCIFQSAQNINLEACLGWKTDEGYCSYLDSWPLEQQPKK